MGWQISRGVKSGCALCSSHLSGHFSDEVLETFHAQDFNISQAEAESMDVVQRLLLEVSYDAFLDAGYEKAELDGKRVGVFVAASGSTEGAYSQMGSPEKDYNSTAPSAATAAVTPSSSVYQTTGYALSVAAGRISFVFGLQGPCMTIDTACSSSLVALHTARRALEHDECELALVVGVNVLHMEATIGCALAGMLSPDGKCHTFDESANGYCRAE
eukprot:gene21962-26919_t